MPTVDPVHSHPMDKTWFNHAVNNTDFCPSMKNLPAPYTGDPYDALVSVAGGKVITLGNWRGFVTAYHKKEKA